MLELLGKWAAEQPGISFLRVLDYISVRASLALAFSFLFCLLLGQPVIQWLRRLQAVQYIRDSAGDDAISLREMHGGKAGTPSMGGILMLGAVVVSALLFADLKQPVFWLAMMAMVGFSFVGFWDDYLKTVRKESAGLSVRQKLAAQLMVGLAFALIYTLAIPHFVQYRVEAGVAPIHLQGPGFLLFPFFKELIVNLGILYIPLAVIILVFTSNAVNLTDGLDGLAAGVTIFAAICFALVAYLTGRADSTQYLIIPHVRGAGELTVLVCAVIGSCMGFLWFNSHPAELFMGDTGSMMLGGLLGAVALLIKQEFLLLIVGGVFVAEAASVILQVGSYKLRARRVFRMAPLHHHFERGGMPESKIIARFYIVSALLALAGLVTLKFR